MTTRRSLALKSPIARMAVAGAASLATVVATAPMALADDDASGAESSQENQSSKVDEPPAEKAEEKTSVQEPVEQKPVEQEKKPESEPVGTSTAEAAATQDEEAGEGAEATSDEVRAIVIEDGADDDTATVTAGSTTGVDIDVLANDDDEPNDYVVITKPPTAGTATVKEDNRTVNYKPSSTPGAPTFDYEVRRPTVGETDDTEGARAAEQAYTVVGTATVTVDVTPVPPVASSDSKQVDENGTVTIDVLSNDNSQSGDSIAVKTGPLHGTVTPTTINPGTSGARPGFSYTPNPGYVGSDSFTYTVTRTVNGQSSTSNVASVSITVNEAPIVADFGFQKFRVGVQSKDGSFSSAGSQMRVVIRDDDGMVVYDEPCTTTAESETSNGTTYCDGLPFGPFSALRGARKIDEPPNTVPNEQTFTLLPGYTARVTQTTAAAGLGRDRDVVNIGACESNAPVVFIPVCLTGNDVDADLKTTTALFVNSSSDSGVKDSTASADDDAVLPDTGAPGSLGLLGLGGLLVAGGVGLAAQGRRSERESGDLA